MFLAILGVCIVMGIVGYVMIEYCYNVGEGLGYLLNFIGIIGSIISLILVIVFGCLCSKLKVIDEKIAMYQEENENIETQIAEVVKQYQEYESGVFADVANDSAINLVSLYPELKADTLVQEQITIYVENNKKIKELKEQKIDGEVYRWWLYFGKSKEE